jgi:mRNA interferase MazF
MVVKRGEIWWASLPEPTGSEPGYRRPVLVVQADEFNRSSIRTVICAPVTSNLNRASAPGNVYLSTRTSSLPKPSVVNVSQLISLDRSRLTDRVKGLDTQSMRQVDDGLRLVMNL